MPRLTTAFAASCLLLFALALSACGGAVEASPAPAPASSDDAGSTTNPLPEASTPEAPEAAPPPPPYPAFTPDMAQIVHQGGAVLSAPVVVTITGSDVSDADAASFEMLADAIGGTPYWKAVASEYGVGPITSGAANHVRMTTPMPDFTQGTALQDLVTSGVRGQTTPKWPAPTDQTIYLLYTQSASFCMQGGGGFHDEMPVDGKAIVFAVSSECASPPFTAFEGATIGASHELGEASIDPHPQTAPGWVGLSDDQLSWDLLQMFQDESGDMCEFYDDSYYKSSDPSLPFMVQRQWSNESAAAGHSPCVPVAPGAYFNVTPLTTRDTVTADLSALAMMGAPVAPSVKAKGFALDVGSTRKVTIGLYSDAPADAWTVTAVEIDPFDPNRAAFDAPATTKTLDLALDQKEGKNGDTLTLTVTRKTATSAKVAEILFVSTSKDGKTKHYWPVLVGSP